MKSSSYTIICIIAFIVLYNVNGSLLRAEPNVAHSNDFSGTLEQVSAHGSPSDTLMSNQYFVSKKHIPSPSTAKGQCDAFKCIEDLIGFFRNSKKFSNASCKPTNGHLQHYLDMDKDKEEASICREIYLLDSCHSKDINPTGIQCVRLGAPSTAEAHSLGCKCRLFGLAGKNTKVATTVPSQTGKEKSGREVLLAGELKKDGTVDKVDKKMWALFN